MSTIEDINLRECFSEGYATIVEKINSSQSGNYCCQAFCGVGKSRFQFKAGLYASLKNGSISLFVFPSIALVTQFNSDYIIGTVHKNHYRTMSICSRNELDNTPESKDVRYTTNPQEISSFIIANKNSPTIICCTYQSLQTFVDSTPQDFEIGFVAFDEGHRSSSSKHRKLIFSNKPFYTVGLFLSATPSTDMKKMERIVYVPYYHALDKKYLKEFELRIDIGQKSTSQDVKHDLIYNSIARAILISGNNRVMTFHSFAKDQREDESIESDEGEEDEGEEEEGTLSRTDVSTFTNKKKFIKAFNHILDTEFPEKKGVYKRIEMTGITAETKKRPSILQKFGITPDNEIHILCSCRTIGEGIDTNRANMCVFADPKQSYRDIIQNIGRILRLIQGHQQIATVLIPTLIDYQPYINTNTLEEKDGVLRSNLTNNLDYNSILNVVSALRQESEEYFEMCLNYPDQYSPEKVKKNIGKNPVIRGGLSEILGHIGYTKEGQEDIGDEELLQQVAEDLGVKIELHTTYREDPVISYGESGEGEPIVIFADGDEDDEDKEHEKPKKYILYGDGTVCDTGWERKEGGGMDIGKILKKRLQINVHTNEDFKVLWNIEEDNFINMISSAVIDCVIQNDIDHVGNWKETLEQVKQYMGDNKKRPSQRDKDEDIKRLGNWIRTQQRAYRTKTGIMKNEEIYNLWTGFINDPEYSVYFDHISNWKETLEQVKQYMGDNKKRPSDRDENKDIKSMGSWIGTQQRAYKKKTGIMANEEIYKLWTEFTADYLSGNYKKKQPSKKCQHKWKFIYDDDRYNYKECESCGRKSKESRLATIAGYNDPNPQKKKEINKWLSENRYIRGKAVVLDAKGLKTSRELVGSGEFKSSDIIIPEYDADTYEENRKDREFGLCVKNGDYLEILKGVKPNELSLVYADFTGSYEKWVKPLLGYLAGVKSELRSGLIFGVTWSDNGVGTTSVRSRISRDMGKYSSVLDLEEMEGSPTENGYGKGGNMNVIFYKRV